MARTPSRAALFFTGYAMQQALTRRQAQASIAWNAIPGVGTGPMGLTPDAIKFGSAYREARQRYNAATAALAAHNRTFCKVFKRELSAMRDHRRAALIARHDARTVEG